MLTLLLGLAPASADPSSEALAVTVRHAAHRCFTDRIDASGVLVARHMIDVRADRDGLVVAEVAVEPGDAVGQDQVLAQLVSPKAPTQPLVALKAPVAGIVAAANAIVGAVTSAGTGDPLFRIAEGGAVELSAETLAASLPRLRPGLPATLHIVGLGDVEGRIASIADGVDARTQLGELRLSVKADPRLRIGNFARAEINAGQECGLTVPLSAVLFSEGGAVVATVQSDHVVMRRVTTGLIQDGDMEISDGLMLDDVVILRAAPFLREGDRVRAVPATP